MLGALVGGGLSLLGSAIQSKGQKDAAAAAQKAQMEMFNQGQQATQPWRDAGAFAIGQMQDLSTLEGQQNFMQQYQDSPMFQNMMQQGSENMLKQASATGGLRTGQQNVAQMQLAPQLMMQGLNEQFARLGQLQAPGAQMASQTAGLASGVGQNIADWNSSAISNSANIWGDAIGGMAPMVTSGLQGLGGMFGGKAGGTTLQNYANNLTPTGGRPGI